jgi:hypothetical protein
MKMAGWIVALVVALGLGGITQAADQTPGPEAFYGRYQGTGLANVMAFGFDQRDFDVASVSRGSPGSTAAIRRAISS